MNLMTATSIRRLLHAEISGYHDKPAFSEQVDFVPKLVGF
jgi:hypothetical protein